MACSGYVNGCELPRVMGIRDIMVEVMRFELTAFGVRYRRSTN